MEAIISHLKKLARDKYKFDIVSDVKENNVCVTGIKVADTERGISIILSDGLQAENETSEDKAKKIMESAEKEFKCRANIVATWEHRLYDWNYVKDCLVSCVCRKNDNREFLKDKVYYEYLDLAIYFRVLLNLEDGSTGSVPVTVRLCSCWNVELENLRMAAWENWSDEKIIVNMKVCLSEFFSNDSGRDVICLEYKGNQYGGSILERTDVLKRISEKKKTDLILVASKGDIMVICPKEITHICYQYWCDIAKESNVLLLKEEPTRMRLDHAYIFSREAEKVLNESETVQYFNNLL